MVHRLMMWTLPEKVVISTMALPSPTTPLTDLRRGPRPALLDTA